MTRAARGRSRPALAFAGVLAAAAAAVAACRSSRAGASPAVLDLAGEPTTPLAVGAGRVHVLVFTSHECPIANAYAPTLRALASRWAARPVALFLVHVDPDLDASAARAHAVAFDLAGTVVLDPTHALARALGITRTPEAAVVTASGCCYRGRIDDQWAALGARSAATAHDLADAVDAVLAGRPVAPGPHDAVGCLLPEPRYR